MDALCIKILPCIFSGFNVLELLSYFACLLRIIRGTLSCWFHKSAFGGMQPVWNSHAQAAIDPFSPFRHGMWNVLRRLEKDTHLAYIRTAAIRRYMLQ